MINGDIRFLVVKELHEIIKCFEYRVAKYVLPEVLPDVVNRVEFWTIRWQKD